MAFLAERFDLLFALKQLTLVIVFLASSHAHLVLNIAELKALLFKLTFRGNKLFSLLVEVTLHLIKIAIKHCNALFQIVNLLIFCEEITLVGLDVVHEDSLFVLSATVGSHSLLQSLEKLVFGMI